MWITLFEYVVVSVGFRYRQARNPPPLRIRQLYKAPSNRCAPGIPANSFPTPHRALAVFKQYIEKRMKFPFFSNARTVSHPDLWCSDLYFVIYAGCVCLRSEVEKPNGRQMLHSTALVDSTKTGHHAGDTYFEPGICETN